MTTRRRCPICRVPKALRISDEITNPHVFCIRGCDRKSLVTALHAERAPTPGGPLSAWMERRADQPSSTPLTRRPT